MKEKKKTNELLCIMWGQQQEPHVRKPNNTKIIIIIIIKRIKKKKVKELILFHWQPTPFFLVSSNPFFQFRAEKALTFYLFLSGNCCSCSLSLSSFYFCHLFIQFSTLLFQWKEIPLACIFLSTFEHIVKIFYFCIIFLLRAIFIVVGLSVLVNFS